MFGSFILIPQLAETPTWSGYGFGLDATEAGLLLVPGTFTLLVAGPLAGWLGNRFGSKIPLAAGGVVAAIALVLLSAVHETESQVIALAIVMTCGIGLAFAAMPNLIVDAVPQEQTGEATGFNALVRSVGSSIGAQAVGAILAGSIAYTGALPTESSFQTAFVLSAAVALVAAFTALAIPPGRARAVQSGPR
jgi:MFS family permease